MNFGAGNAGCGSLHNDASYRNKIFFFCLFVLLGLSFFNVVGTAADSALPKEARFSERIFGLKGLTNVGRVVPYLYRGAQPTADGYATLKVMGINTVVNLRTTSSERQKVEGAGHEICRSPVKCAK
jgi:hypothetical protein